MLPADEIRRRIRAARALAGITVDELSGRLDGQRLSTKTLGNIERGDRDARPMELRAIAAACGVSYAFFTVDFSTLPEGIGQEGSLHHRIALLEELVQVDELREMLDMTRRAKALLDDGDPETQAGNGTQQPADATPESDPSQPARKRRSADGGVG